MTKIKDIKDLGENEAIHCKTIEEAIEINNRLGNIIEEVEIRHAFEKYGPDLCINNEGYSPTSYYEKECYIIHPASSFLPESFYQVEPKVGQLWECYNPALVPVGVMTKIVATEAPYKDLPMKVFFSSEGYTTGEMYVNDFYEFFKFHSNPETMKTEETTLNTKEDTCKDSLQVEQPISERKAASFRFYDQLPPELARQAKENFDERWSETIPANLPDAIRYGWKWTKGKNGNKEFWDQIESECTQGKYNLSEASSVVVQPDFDLYSKLDDNGKKVMRETYRNVEWPKVKEYVTRSDWSYSDDYAFLNRDEPMNLPIILSFKNCTPEIVGNEIRFVKND